MMLVAEQPVGPNSARKAKTPALVMCLKGPTISDSHVHRWHFACFGNKSHYRKDGTCVHLETVLETMSAWRRQRTWFVPFGDQERPRQRVPQKEG